MRFVRIGDRSVGEGQRVFLVAEAGVNHNGDVHLAKRLVSAAAEAGADAVKFQTFNADKVVTRGAPKAAYQLAETNPTESQYEMVRSLELSREAHFEILRRAREHRIQFFSTPFDEESADFLKEMGVPVIKVPSGEITNERFVDHVAREGLPVILSTGMASLGEVETAVASCDRAGNGDLVLLHCTSAYPADAAEANLLAMRTLATAFGLPVGYSDHTLGAETALAAVALGACVIEKHFTLDRNLPGPDHRASLEPAELAAFIQSIRTVELALGTGRKQRAKGEMDTAAVARRSLVAARDIPPGTRITEDLVAVRRPGTGLPPRMLAQLLGRVVRVSVPAGTLFSLEMFA